MEENNKSVGLKENLQKHNKEIGKNYLLVIGIDKYSHCPTLYNAVKDADDFIKILIDKYQFELDNTLFIKNEEATKDVIINAFRKLSKQTTSNDNIVIYYSGHGAYDEDFKESYWIMSNSRNGNIGDYLSHDRLIRFIRAINSHHTLLIIDACFAGAFLINRRNTSKALEKDPSRYVIASGRKEFASDGQPGENSPFATAILEKLNATENSLIASDLAQYVKKQTIKATNGTQRPINNPLSIPEDKGGEFVFHRKSSDNFEHSFTLPETSTLPTKRKPIFNRRIIKFIPLVLVLSLISGWLIFNFSNSSTSSNDKQPPNGVEEMVKSNLKTSKPEILTFTDLRDKNEYQFILAKDSNYWMSQNLNFHNSLEIKLGPEGEKPIDSFGAFYNWDQAMKACPKGWRLPTLEEFQKFASNYGGYDYGELKIGNSSDSYNILIQNGYGGFNANLAGFLYHGEFTNLSATGLYWTSTEVKEGLSEFRDQAYAFHFDKTEKRLSVYPDDKKLGFSCRCIKE